MQDPLITASKQSQRSDWHREVEALLLRVAEDDNLAEDLENGAIKIRHPELLPQRKRDR